MLPFHYFIPMQVGYRHLGCWNKVVICSLYLEGIFGKFGQLAVPVILLLLTMKGETPPGSRAGSCVAPA